MSTRFDITSKTPQQNYWKSPKIIKMIFSAYLSLSDLLSLLYTNFFEKALCTGREFHLINDLLLIQANTKFAIIKQILK